ncbi:Lsr2 family protein [Corynebacterium pseudotuberculosis]|uniref:histone-like nucleoid-structuring protein Lsr2 n=1 Tax=Corynebacterium pseudotuberculosis TaxID=1719 RepID=UPI001BCDE658|nr:Lsr2 family protein [Corynebacterium pseudotuberculosis]
MARREITQFFDDIDNTPLDESEVRVISFSFDGEDFTIDLSEENAEKFREAIRPYTEKASRTMRQRTPVGHDPKDVRQWAKSKKIDIAARGKIPQEVIDAYVQAHKR